MSGAPLVCPRCSAAHEDPSERFCHACGMPLVFADAEPGADDVTATQARARKVKKQYLDGDLVRVAVARHQAEAEWIQGMLLEEGIASMHRRSRGFDVPDMLAAGPRDILVPAGGVGVAREVLLQVAVPTLDPERSAIDAPGRIAAGLLVAMLVVGLLAWLGTELAG